MQATQREIHSLIEERAIVGVDFADVVETGVIVKAGTSAFYPNKNSRFREGMPEGVMFAERAGGPPMPDRRPAVLLPVLSVDNLPAITGTGGQYTRKETPAGIYIDKGDTVIVETPIFLSLPPGYSAHFQIRSALCLNACNFSGSSSLDISRDGGALLLPFTNVSHTHRLVINPGSRVGTLLIIKW